MTTTAAIANYGFSFQQDELSQIVMPSTEQPEKQSDSASQHTEGLVADLAWILVLAAIVTIVFKKMRQPVVLGYILAGFIASPKFEWLPSITSDANIQFWAELGIVIMMFCLGVEFSFKKLMKAGGSAIGTAFIIITGMTLAGFGVGRLLDFNIINCIFLGGMISMSSTTIILKSLTDLGMRQKKFASQVLAVLIIEDLFAVLMLVVLSAVAVGDFKGGELFMAIAKLAFFLVIWFVVGVYALPIIFTRFRSVINDETLLVISMALCFGMAVFSVMCGFSMELGSFVTGSILAGTVMAERIEKVVQPVKDLFGAVFFISVGMMVDPDIIARFWPQILLLAAVVVVGMIIFGSFGMLITGQTLRVAIESGFTLTQIGEFSFIIASLGMSLGVLNPQLYPIIVAVSVITIFTTPYFIKLSQPAVRFAENHLPENLKFLIDRYSDSAQTAYSDTRKTWRKVIIRFFLRLVLFSFLLIALLAVCGTWLRPLMFEMLGDKFGRLASTVITLVVMLPFLAAMCMKPAKTEERNTLTASTSFANVPLVGMQVVKYACALGFIIYPISVYYGVTIGWLVGIGGFILLIAVVSNSAATQYKRMEKRFMDNLNERDNTRYGTNNTIVGDLHQAYIKVGPGCPFVGDRLRDSGLRRDYGVSVSSIQRGDDYYPLPDSAARIFPGDILGIIGSDDAIKHLNDDIERFQRVAMQNLPQQPRVELNSIRLSENSPIVGKPLRRTDIREDFFSMIIMIHHPGGQMEQPEPDTILSPGDTIWVVGDPDKIKKLI